MGWGWRVCVCGGGGTAQELMGSSRASQGRPAHSRPVKPSSDSCQAAAGRLAHL